MMCITMIYFNWLQRRQGQFWIVWNSKATPGAEKAEQTKVTEITAVNPLPDGQAFYTVKQYGFDSKG